MFLYMGGDLRNVSIVSLEQQMPAGSIRHSSRTKEGHRHRRMRQSRCERMTLGSNPFARLTQSAKDRRESQQTRVRENTTGWQMRTEPSSSDMLGVPPSSKSGSNRNFSLLSMKRLSLRPALAHFSSDSALLAGGGQHDTTAHPTRRFDSRHQNRRFSASSRVKTKDSSSGVSDLAQTHVPADALRGSVGVETVPHCGVAQTEAVPAEVELVGGSGKTTSMPASPPPSPPLVNLCASTDDLSAGTADVDAATGELSEKRRLAKEASRDRLGLPLSRPLRHLATKIHMPHHLPTHQWRRNSQPDAPSLRRESSVEEPEPVEYFSMEQLEAMFNAFDATAAECFKVEEKEKLLAVIEAGFGEAAEFSALIRSTFTKSVLEEGQWRIVHSSFAVSDDKSVAKGGLRCKIARWASSTASSAPSGLSRVDNSMTSSVESVSVSCATEVLPESEEEGTVPNRASDVQSPPDTQCISIIERQSGQSIKF